MKKFTFKGVLDGIRSSNKDRPEDGPGGGGKLGPGGAGPGRVGGEPGVAAEIVENLRPEHFRVLKTFCHGFPYQPTSMAFDPVQRLIAIGTKCGCIRILGRPGVDCHVKHDTDCSAVIHMQFVFNEGALISASADDILHYWSFKSGKKPEVVQSLKFQRERITCLSLPFQSKWAYVGTERGNVHVVNIENFSLSGYIINWNKAIELSRKTHPGSVIYLGDNPTDSNKLLIGFDSGQLVIWDLRIRAAETRYQAAEPLRSISWHSDGKQFMCSHSDGSLTTWNTRVPSKPVGHTYPHARCTKDGKPEPCKSIQKVEWKSSRTGENFVIFSGGLTADRAGKTPSLTVIHGKTTTVLEMEHNVLDFIPVCESQWESEVQDPYAIVVLLQQDLVVIDLLTPGYPCFENPYPMDIHESPVTCCTYIADCPGDLIPALYSVGSKAIKKTGFSDKDFPIDGGQWGSTCCSYAEIIITGHADGSVKFWDASSTSLQVLYKLKTSKPFERPKNRRSTESSTSDDDPFAVQYLGLCPESRLLAVAGASCQVLVFKFRKQEAVSETTVLEIPIIWEVEDVSDYFTGGGGFDFAKTGDTNKANLEYFVPIRVKTGPQKKPAGYQVEIVCLTPWVNGEPPGGITSIAINSSYGLLSYGNESGLVIVDIVQRTCLLNMGTPDLYGTADPYQRAPKSPKRPDIYEERSPTEQVSDLVSNQSEDILDTPHNTPKSPCINESNYDEDVSSTTSSFRQSISGSMGKLPLTNVTSEPKGMQPQDDTGSQTSIPKCRSTTPPLEEGQGAPAETGTAANTTNNNKTANRTRSHTWSQVKVLIKQMRANKQKGGGGGITGEQSDKKLRQTLSYPASPGGPVGPDQSAQPLGAAPITSSTSALPEPDTQPESLHLSLQQLQQASTPSAITPLDQLVTTSPSLSADDNINSGDSSDSSSPPLSRPTNLPLNLDPTNPSLQQQGQPVRPPRTKKKKSSLLTSFNKDKKPRCVDLRSSQVSSGSTFTNMMKKFHKLDSNFSRSRSSSMSSLDNITSEAIQCLTFVDSFTKKGDTVVYPTLWVGTSLGSIISIAVNLPSGGRDVRRSELVSVNPSGTIFRLKGSMLLMSFLDCNGNLMPSTYEAWRDEAKERSRTPTKGLSTASRQSPTQLSLDSGGNSGVDRQFLVVVSEKQCRVIALPSQTCLYKQQLCEASFVIKAEVTTVKDSSCLVCYLSNGHLMILSIPSLRQLIDIDFVPLADLSFHQTRKSGIVDPMLSIWGQQMIVNEDTNSIAKTFCISSLGHGMYLSSPSEIQKFAVSTEFSQMMDSLLGQMFMEREMPERPKESFLTGLFGGGVRNVDREELFGEASGKSSKSVAKLMPGPTAPPGFEHAQMRAGTLAGEVAKTRMQLVERGQKLGQLEDKTEKMMNESENFSNAAHQLMLKYKDKKWYQL